MPIETFSRREFLRQSGLLSGLGLVSSSESRGRVRQRHQPQVDAAGHPMYCVNVANTGYNPDETGPDAPISREWRYRTEGEVASSPAVVDDTVYVGSYDGNVYALSATDGTEQWRVQTDAGVVSSPAIVGGTVYVGSGTVGSEDGTVFALDAGDGTVQWDTQINEFVTSPPAVVGGSVYVGGGDRSVYALSAADGTERWRFQTGPMSGVPTSPAVVNGTVYVGSFDTNVYALSATDGTEQWRFRAESGVASSPAVVDGTVYVGDNSLDAGIVYAVSAADGTEQWRAQTIGRVASSPAVVGDTVYVGSSGGFLYALSAADGAEQWRFQTDGAVVSSPVVVDGTVYVGSDDGNVYALSAADGTEQWRFQTGDSVESSPAVVGGTVYVGSDDGSVYALTEGTLTPEIEGPDGTLVGETVTFEGSVPTAENATYEWSFGTDAAFTATGKRVTHSFAEQGEYTVQLRVSTDGTRYTATQTVAVAAVTTPVATPTVTTPVSTPTVTPQVVDHTTEQATTRFPETGSGRQYAPETADTTARETSTTDSPNTTVLGGVIAVSSTIAGLAAWKHVRSEHDDEDDGTGESTADPPDSSDSADDGSVDDEGGQSGGGEAEPVDRPEASETVDEDPATESTTEYEPPSPKTPAGAFLQKCDRVERIRPVDTAGPVHVYSGRYPDGDDSEQACIYALAPNHTGTADAVEAFGTAAREWEGISKNTHVATVYDSGDEPRPWVAFDPGIGQLNDVLSSLERDARVDAIAHLAEAVRTAGMYNLVHGSISPSVAFIGEDLSANPVVTLAGWGVRQAVARVVGADWVTPYTAPEQLTGDSAGTETDTYRLGAVAYRILTGHPPFVDADDPRSAIVNGDLTPPTVRDPSLPDGVDSAIGDAMATTPSERPQPYDFRQRLTAAMTD